MIQGAGRIKVRQGPDVGGMGNRLRNLKMNGNHEKAGQAVTLKDMRSLIRLVMWAALIGVGGWVSIPLGVPISLQPLFVLLAGLADGPKMGASAAGLYLLAGLIGLPVFAGGLAGPAILLKPSAGFALAFPLGAAVAGLACRGGYFQKNGFSFMRGFFAAMAGETLIYVFGVLGMMVNAQMSFSAACLALLYFIPGDLIKCAAASSIVLSGLLSRGKTARSGV